MTPAVKMVERALAAWHQAIIAAPETEEVDARRRRCMRAALSAALPLPVEGVDAAIKRLWPNGLGPKNLDELVVFVEEERKCDAEYLANAVKIVQSERAKRYLSALASPSAEAAQPVATKDTVPYGWNLVSEQHLDALVTALAEIKATNDGESNQPIGTIIEWALERIKTAPPYIQGFGPSALAQLQGELREGMVLVPREPTEAMILTQGKSRPDLAKTDGIRNVAQELNEIVRADAVRIYKEMIDAAIAGRTAG
jgi:hypothetical protein